LLIEGIVKNATTGNAISGAIVRLTGYENYEVLTGTDGSFNINEVYTNHNYNLSIQNICGAHSSWRKQH
jgi:hypothetical protein